MLLSYMEESSCYEYGYIMMIIEITNAGGGAETRPTIIFDWVHLGYHSSPYDYNSREIKNNIYHINRWMYFKLRILLYEKAPVVFVIQPPFYSREHAEMYDNILHKPLKLRGTISTPAKSLLEGVCHLIIWQSHILYTPKHINVSLMRGGKFEIPHPNQF